MKTKESTYTAIIIGEISIDSGLVWIGDPAYVIHHPTPSSLGNEWTDFCDILEDNGTNTWTFDHDSGIPGLGIVSSTKEGDGFYQVVGLYENNDTRPSYIIIDFVGKIKSGQQIKLTI